MDRPRSKKVWLRILLLGFCWVLLASFCLAGGSFLGFINRSKVMTEVGKIILTKATPQDVFHSDAVTLLILGCDEDRAYAGPGKKRKPGAILRHASRSDMMMVAKIDFAHSRITGISIPRDTLWAVPGYREQKINAYHAIGLNEGGEAKGQELAREAAEGVTGVKIDRVVVLNYEAFQQMIDLLGGIDIFVPRNMDYDDYGGDLHIHLKKGRQVLNGYNAMCYVRYRHGDSDFKRQERQKDLMVAVKDQMVKKWEKTPDVVDKTIDLLGRAFNPREIASLALFGQKIGADNIKMDMVPVVEETGSTGLRIDQPQLALKLKELHLTGDDTAPTPVRG